MKFKIPARFRNLPKKLMDQDVRLDLDQPGETTPTAQEPFSAPEAPLATEQEAPAPVAPIQQEPAAFPQEAPEVVTVAEDGTIPCVPCGGEGLKDQATLCPECGGLGKVR